MSSFSIFKESKVALVGVVLVGGYLAYNSPALHEARVVRDLRGVTAFTDVVVHHTAVDRDGGARTLRVTGEIRKLRCDKLSHAVQTKHADETFWRYATFKSLEGPEVPQNRLASVEAESFGPWQILALSPHPKRGRMTTRHECTDPRTGVVTLQDNVVFDVLWRNYERE